MTMKQTLKSLSAHLRSSIAGTMVIETAIVMPVLVVISLGVFDTGRMFARQTFLQSAIGEATAIALAAGSGATTDVNQIKDVLVQSSKLPADQITVLKKYRCGDDPTLLDSSSTCTTGEEVSTYLQVTITDTYKPMWTEFGVGHDITYDVTRTSQVA